MKRVPLLLLVGCTFDPFAPGGGQALVRTGTTTTPLPTPACGVAYRLPSGIVPQVDLGDAWAAFEPPSGGDPDFGDGAVASDVTGDGCTDFTISGTTGIWVFEGPIGPGVWSADEAHVFVPVADVEDDYLRLRDAGDLDGDGDGELWYGASLFDIQATGPTELLEAPRYAYQLESGFDLDGDGHGDVLWSTSEAQVWIVYGPIDAATFPPLEYRFRGPVANGAFFEGPVCDDWGSTPTVTAPGDISGDGLTELVFGGPSGASIVEGGDYRGQTVAECRAGSWDFAHSLDEPVEASGDVDADGVLEFHTWLPRDPVTLERDYAIVSGATLRDPTPVRLVESGDYGLIFWNLGHDYDAFPGADFLVDGPSLLSSDTRGVISPTSIATTSLPTDMGAYGVSEGWGGLPDADGGGSPDLWARTATLSVVLARGEDL